ncbi:nuclear transport factor 2 family protein [Henriciella mobilis]|uniref:Nuclear transport factor 2 family protein n=1 Tax=Henriciella mobilis TaxID=2305467 RepID=A0A399RBT3_9PROT|nr:nuclear transport factor 2 family protein [Henriciella mobilis]
MLAKEEQAFRNWLAAFGKRMESGESNAMAALFAADVVFHLSPFDAPLRGREAVEDHFRKTLAARESIRFTAEVITPAHDEGWAHWACGFTRTGTDDPVRQEGIMRVVLDDSGICTHLQQWWNSIEPGQSDLMRDTDA